MKHIMQEEKGGPTCQGFLFLRKLCAPEAYKESWIGILNKGAAINDQQVASEDIKLREREREK